MSRPSDDIYELREQIKTMIQTIKSLEEEKKQSEKEGKEYEIKLMTLRTEGNILGALEQVRYHDLNEMIGRTGGSVGGGISQGISGGGERESVGGEIFDQKFLEENLKLELQILNAELRHNLPKIEKEAIESEYSYQNAENLLKKEQKRKENLSVKPQELINQEVSELLDKRRKIEGQN
jgi:hypothetical protein